jgi:hypothetical protein
MIEGSIDTRIFVCVSINRLKQAVRAQLRECMKDGIVCRADGSPLEGRAPRPFLY